MTALNQSSDTYSLLILQTPRYSIPLQCRILLIVLFNLVKHAAEMLGVGLVLLQDVPHDIPNRHELRGRRRLALIAGHRLSDTAFCRFGEVRLYR